jgi:two-component system cell cycle sensor histidine kinase/response regulator CckA
MFPGAPFPFRGTAISRSQNLIRRPCLSLFIFLVLAINLPASVQAQNNHKKSVLVLHSYNYGYGWTDSIMKGIEAVLPPQKYSLTVEYMDTKRYDKPAFFQKLLDLYHYKFAAKKFDVIICSDDNAFNFLKRHKNDLFAPETPVVFCGVNFFRDADLKGHQDITGVVESYDITGTINIIRKLTPNLKKILVLSDRTATGVSNTLKTRKVMAENFPQQKYTIVDNVTLEELLQTLERSPEGTVALYLGWAMDRRGKSYAPLEESLALISRHSHLPIYSVWEFTLESVVGGMITSGYYQGEMAARMAKRLMAGEKPVDIPVVKESPNKPMFNYRQMKRFGISPSQLPEGSIIISRPYSFYDQHKSLVWGTILIFFTFSLVVFLLTGAVMRQRRAEEALRKSEEQYRLLVNQIPAVVYKGYLDWSLDCFDQKIEEITGYAKEEFDSRRINWLDLIFPEDVAQAKKLLIAAKKGDGSYISEHRLRKRTGEVRWIQTRNQIVYDSKGKIDHISGVFFDVTERKNLEEERDRLFNMSLDMLCVAGFDGFFKQLNPAWSKTLGWPERELLKRPWLDFVHPEDHMATTAAGERLQRGLPVVQFENRFQCLDGSYRWISWNSFPLPEEKLIFGVARDVTEKRHMEEQLLKAQKMEAVGRLAGGVAHDFNNLLTAIMGYSEIMKMDLKPEDPLSFSLEEIIKATNRGASLTNQLLAFSRKQILQPQAINLNTTIMNIREMLQRLIGEDIDLATYLEEKVGLVKADPSQIDQILMNLAVNARDAMPQGGKLTLETANADLDDSYCQNHVGVTPGAYVMLAVSDNGSGMDAETLSRIFEPFFSTKETGKGTGLGLATVYGIVRQSGGHIWVYSEPGKGTTFKVYLPRVEESAEEQQLKAAAPTTLEGTETILVAEDDAALRQLIAKALRRYGYKVLEAAHGGEALLLCEKEKVPIHLMLTDVVMPKISGRDLAERLKPSHPEMKVLYMSGYTENAIVHHGVLNSDVNFILKPFKVLALLQKVREVLDTTAPS